MHNENWDDLRFVLAVAETGSVLQASKLLGVNHATVLRRVASFEERHVTILFERTPQGYRLLPDSAHIIRAAQAAEAAMADVGRLAAGGRLNLRGTVRVTSTDTLCGLILPHFVASLRSEERDLSISLISSNTYLDFQREQTVVAVRPSEKLPNDMIGRIAAELGFAAYAQSHDQDAWLGLSGPLSRSVGAQWMIENVPETKVTTTADSFIALREMAALGHGIAILPCFLGDPDSRLTRLTRAMPHLQVPIWVARHVDALESPSMRLVQSRLITFLSTQTTLSGH